MRRSLQHIAEVIADIIDPEVNDVPQETREIQEMVKEGLTTDQLEDVCAALVVTSAFVGDKELPTTTEALVCLFIVKLLRDHRMIRNWSSFGDPEGFEEFMREVEKL